VIFTEEQVKKLKRKKVEVRRNAEDRRDDAKRRQAYQGTTSPDRQILDEGRKTRTTGEEQ
jgi:hypothetical protein